MEFFKIAGMANDNRSKVDSRQTNGVARSGGSQPMLDLQTVGSVSDTMKDWKEF
jgi:hypothetical protein